MEDSRVPVKPKRPRIRKLCGHCNESLSYTAYWSHRARYFNESERKWITTTISDSQDPVANNLSDEHDDEDTWSFTEFEEQSQLGNKCLNDY